MMRIAARIRRISGGAENRAATRKRSLLEWPQQAIRCEEVCIRLISCSFRRMSSPRLSGQPWYRDGRSDRASSGGMTLRASSRRTTPMSGISATSTRWPGRAPRPPSCARAPHRRRHSRPRRAGWRWCSARHVARHRSVASAAVELRRDGRCARGGESVATHELVEIRPHHREGGGPHDLRLALRIELVHVHQLRGVDLVLREIRGRRRARRCRGRARSPSR